MEAVAECLQLPTLLLCVSHTAAAASSSSGQHAQQYHTTPSSAVSAAAAQWAARSGAGCVCVWSHTCDLVVLCVNGWRCRRLLLWLERGASDKRSSSALYMRLLSHGNYLLPPTLLTCAFA